MTRSKVWTLFCLELWWPLHPSLQPRQGPHSCVPESVETIGKRRLSLPYENPGS